MRRPVRSAAVRAMACSGARTTRTAGVSTVAAGLGLVGLGLWARRDVRGGLERIVSTPGSNPPSAPVVDGAAARSLAEVIDPVTGEPVQNPAQALWLQSSTLQTALMQAYLAQRMAELSVGLGTVLVGVGTGLAAVTRR